MFMNMGFFESVFFLLGAILKNILDPTYTWWMRLRFGKIYNKAYVEEQLSDVVVAATMLKKSDKKLYTYFSEKGNAEAGDGYISYWITIAKTFEFCIDNHGKMFVRGVGHSGIYIERLYKGRTRRVNFEEVIDVNSLDEAINIIRELNYFILQNK